MITIIMAYELSVKQCGFIQRFVERSRQCFTANEYVGGITPYEEKTGYVYAFGKRNLGKECILLTEDNSIIKEIVKLKTTPDNIYKCLKHQGRGV